VKLIPVTENLALRATERGALPATVMLRLDASPATAHDWLIATRNGRARADAVAGAGDAAIADPGDDAMPAAVTVTVTATSARLPSVPGTPSS
jgi:hypothetical protein